MVKRRTRKVSWNPGEKPIVRNKPLPPYVADFEMTPSESAAREPYLAPGSLWRTVTGLTIMDEAYGYMPWVVPYLYSGRGVYTFQRGAMAVYMGTVRVEETMHDKTVRVLSYDKTVRVLRHCFLVGGGRYLTNNLTDYIPVTA
jgi:hypothetical protein